MQPTSIKMVLAFVLLAAGIVASGSMLALLGGAKQPTRPGWVRNAHRIAGYAFALTLAALAVAGVRMLSAAGDGLSLRGVLHWAAGSLLVIVTVVKILLVRYYRKFLRVAPGVGVLVLVLAVLVAVLSAGFVLITGGRSHGATRLASAIGGPDMSSAASDTQGGDPSAVGVASDMEAGRLIFESHCSECHGRGAVQGEMLVGLFEHERLRSSGLAVSIESVTSQILDPVGMMPSFRTRLTGREIAVLLEYLESL